MLMQALLRVVSESKLTQEREREIGFCVLYSLSSSVAVLLMVPLKGDTLSTIHHLIALIIISVVMKQSLY